MTHQDTEVLVLGIVGICNAIALNEKGFNVTLVDRDEPSDATSFACTAGRCPSINARALEKRSKMAT